MDKKELLEELINKTTKELEDLEKWELNYSKILGTIRCSSHLEKSLMKYFELKDQIKKYLEEIDNLKDE